MKKLLIVAALALSTAAFAQTNVTVGGEVRMFEDNTKIGNGPSVTRMVSDQAHVGFKATEALANGLSVNVNVDTFVATNAPTTAATSLGDYQSTIGVSNKFGSIDLGRKKTALALAADGVDPFGTNYGSTFAAVHNVQTIRLNNGVFVKSASFGGFQAEYDYGQSNVAGVAGTTGLGASYSAFGGDVHYAGQFEKATGAKTNLVGVGYTVPGIGTKLGFDHSNSFAATGAARTQGNSFAVTQPVWANLAVKGTYGESKTDRVADNTKAYSLGAVYSLSKRTAIEAAYSDVNAPGTVADVRSFGVGLTHAF